MPTTTDTPTARATKFAAGVLTMHGLKQLADLYTAHVEDGMDCYDWDEKQTHFEAACKVDRLLEGMMLENDWDLIAGVV